MADKDVHIGAMCAATLAKRLDRVRQTPAGKRSRSDCVREALDQWISAAERRAARKKKTRRKK